MGIGSRVWGLLWDVVALLGLSAAYALTPLRIDMHSVWAWVALLVAEDLCYYCFHRASHRVRLFWASHVVHHSSQYYNLSTALRQEWTGLGTFVFWVPLALRRLPGLGDLPAAVDQPDLPVLPAHRADPPAAAPDRAGDEHAVAPPRAPRRQQPVPRQELRRHPHRLGPAASAPSSPRSSDRATASPSSSRRSTRSASGSTSGTSWATTSGTRAVPRQGRLRPAQPRLDAGRDLSRLTPRADAGRPRPPRAAASRRTGRAGRRRAPAPSAGSPPG